MPFRLPEDRVTIMGVLNVTPDSFSDGGQFLSLESAAAHAVRMSAEGADVVDVGGESTRPGAEPVAPEEELRRVLPVVEALASLRIPVSIDTSKAQVAKACLMAGASVVNDVTALADSQMAKVCAEAGSTVCLMHMRGDPRTMQADPVYDNVVTEVRDFLCSRADYAALQGIEHGNIWIDPGVGFGKTVEHNLELLSAIDAIAAAGYPVVVGVSRKSFIGKLLGSEAKPLPTDQRLEGSLAAQVVAQVKGARVVRTHDVAESKKAATIASAILTRGSGSL